MSAPPRASEETLYESSQTQTNENTTAEEALAPAGEKTAAVEELPRRQMKTRRQIRHLRPLRGLREGGGDVRSQEKVSSNFNLLRIKGIKRLRAGGVFRYREGNTV